MAQYYVDERIRCVAVRNRPKDDPDYNGLWPDTPGVVEFWMGAHESQGWTLLPGQLEAAQALCDQYNAHSTDVPLT